MVAGGIFDSMWDPYSPAFAYPRTQPRPRYYRPRAPMRAVSDHYSNVTEPVKPVTTAKNVKTIPVTDGPVPAEKVAEKVPIPPVAVARFKSEPAAATKIQAVYRGYVVRRMQALQHFRVIQKVKEELETLKLKFAEKEQKQKLWRDAQERVRWVEGVMALLLRLDSLQGVHSEVRMVRKGVAKEVVGFQEVIDSMSSAPPELNGEEDVVNAVDSDMAKKCGEEMENEECSSDEVSGEQESENANASDGQGDVKAIEDCSISEPSSEKHVPAQAPSDVHNQVIADSVAAPDCCDQSGSLPGLVGESVMVEAGLVSEPNAISTEADAEVPMDVENKEQMFRVSPAHRVEKCEEVESASSQNPSSLHVESDDQEASRVTDHARDAVVTEPISETDALAAPVQNNIDAEIGMSLCGVNGVTRDNSNISAHPEETETASEITDGGKGCIIPVSLEGDISPKPADKTNNASSDRELLLQLLEENRKLKDVVGKVLQWGKQQSDVIHSLSNRIAQLEEQDRPSKLLHGKDDVDGRKRIVNCVCSVDNMGRSRRRLDKGRRSGQRIGYVDSGDQLESGESDEYF